MRSTPPTATGDGGLSASSQDQVPGKIKGSGEEPQSPAEQPSAGETTGAADAIDAGGFNSQPLTRSEVMNLPEGSVWERLGWLAASLWLVFLAFPLIILWSGEAYPLPVRLGITALLGIFAVVYTVSVRDSYATEELLSQVRATPRVVISILVMSVICAISISILGPGAVGMLIFVQAYSAYATGLRQATIIAAATFAGAVLVITVWQAWPNFWFFLIVIVAVAMTTLVGRYFAERSELESISEREFEMRDERERLAKDLHDLLGHTLTVIAVKSELADRTMDAHPERARQEIQQIRHLTREAITEIRQAVSGLANPSLEHQLQATHDALRSAGLTTTLIGQADEVEVQYRALFSWVLRESVTNIVRHSDANHCEVALAPRTLRITDDGAGFPTAALDHLTEGHGLRNIRSRIEQAGGGLIIANQDSGGARLEVRM